MKKKIVSMLALTTVALFSFDAAALVPDLIPIQGVLADNVGAPIDGPTDITFSFYSAETGGAVLWTDDFTDVDVADGFFTVYLGSNTALDFSTLISNPELWLGINVESDGEMGRIELATVPFAVEAQVCQAVGGLTEADINANFAASSHNHDGVYAPVSHAHSWNDITSDVPVDFADGTDDGFTTEEELTDLLNDNYAATSHDHMFESWGDASTDTAGLSISNNATTGNAYAFQGISESQTGTAVRGHADNNIGSNVGVYGRADGDGGYSAGVVGEHYYGGTGVAAWSYTGDLFRGYDGSFPTTTALRFQVTNAGNVLADGTYSSPAADFAELLPAGAGDLVAGDVLAINASGELVKSTAPFQTTVAGVYSTKPAFLGGAGISQGPKDIPMAVVGVVHVKATAENGPVKAGDLLVSSSTPGHAMRAGASSPNGTVIGKALENLTGSVGAIKMLVMAQ